MRRLGDPILTAIEFALEDTLKRYENPKEENRKIIREGIVRGKMLIHHIRIMGVQVCGMTREEYDKDLRNKNTVVLMTEEEFEEYNRAMRLLKVAREEIGGK